jgi:hypothetical protein
MHSNVNDYEVYDSADESHYDGNLYDPQDYEEYNTDYEDDEYDIDEYAGPLPNAMRRIMRLSLILLLLLFIAAVILFAVIPYVQAMSHSAPPLLPALQA